MFTGITETIGTVRALRHRGGGGGLLSVELGGGGAGSTGRWTDAIACGESIAVNGACLTVVRIDGAAVDFDVSGETFLQTTLGQLRAGAKVNIERALPAAGRFGGHFVLGHVDGVGQIERIERRGEFAQIRVALQKGLLDEMVIKGSVAVDGISLTVAGLDEQGFEASVIPATLGNTTLGGAGAGDKVNIETDVLVKAVKRQLGGLFGSGGGLDGERLRELGF